MNLINTDIVPDPYDPQAGDVYEFGDPFVQRLVVEDAPTREDPRVRYRIDGGVDSNLTSVAQFHRHLAGLTGLRGVGRVREYPPITAEVRKSLVRQLRSTALGVDQAVGEAEGLDCADTPLDNKVAMINSLCPPGWRVGMEGSGVAVFQLGETVPMTIMGDSEARVVAEIWRWHIQPVERRLAEFQNGLADILGWPVPQLHDPSGASDILTEVRVRFGTKTPWRHDHFKAIADDLRLAASLEDSGSCNNVRSAEAMRTAAATIMELAAMLRSIDETLRSSLPDKGEASTLELLASLVAEKQRAVPSLETALRACEADFDAIRSAYLDVNGTTGTLVEIVGSIRGSCEMQARVMNLKELLTERESDIKKLADMLKDVLGRIGTEDAK